MAEDPLKEWAEGFQKWLWNRISWEWFFLMAVGGGLAVTSFILGRFPWESASKQGTHSSKKVITVEADKETVSRIFARAPYFKVIEDDRVVKVVSNPYVEAVPAGPPAARLVAGFNPQVVVTGSIGSLARKELEDRGIRIELR